MRVLDETRKRRFGTRDPSFVGGSYGVPPLNDGLAAIAVPLLGRSRVYGAINILWIRSAFEVEVFAANHLAELEDAASRIVALLEDVEQRAPRAAGATETPG